MNDQLIIDNYLLVLKSTVEVYVHGTLESNNLNVRDILKTNLNNTIEMQDRTYKEMVNRNWYNVTNVSKKQIDELLKKINTNNN